ncbi:hypothetical protein AB1Y20_022577 [Prymnesium parvum]|uniref:Protease Do-like PDZ domain-containing protein n=1 Tax=Prymnesium parvum TaxID=97485 RepID=A0AB34JID6_PRYPA
MVSSGAPVKRAPPKRTAELRASTSQLPDISQMSVVGMGGGTRSGGGARPPSLASAAGRPAPKLYLNFAACGAALTDSPSHDSSEMRAHSSDGGGRPLMPVTQAFQACVKVYCTSVAPCYALPWIRGEESHSTSSGFAVALPSGHHRLLVQAQVVENCTRVQVRRDGHAQKYVARVECVGHDCHLAVLNVDDDQFWRGMPALPLPVGLPQTMSEVLAAGFPAGGDELSTSRGVVNRILLGGPSRDLCVQINPGVQAGQAGGPVFLTNGQLVGMACCGREQNAHLSGYIIPMPVIHTFLQNAQVQGVYTPAGPSSAALARPIFVSKCVDSYRVQPIENVELRLQLGLPGRPAEGEDGGVLITRVPKDSPSYGLLHEKDVLLAIDGHQIASDGTVLLHDSIDPLRVNLRHIVQRATLGSTLKYLVLRESKKAVVSVPAQPRLPRLLPARHPTPTPQWLVLGGLVFVPLLPEYEAIVPKSKLAAIHEPPQDGEQVVLLLRVLQAEINIGYEDICGMMETFNGEKVISLAHMNDCVKKLRQQNDHPQLEFVLVTGELLVLDAEICWATEEEIFSVHAIPRRCSLDADDL